ncbi:unnamed protein product, partial [Allacma fusca]
DNKVPTSKLTLKIKRRATGRYQKFSSKHSATRFIYKEELNFRIFSAFQYQCNLFALLWRVPPTSTNT